MQFIISTSEFDVVDSLVLGLGSAYRDCTVTDFYSSNLISVQHFVAAL